ncbi:Lipopolysaccharide core heptose(II) kinase RfaY [Tolypocladium capitatum]|uniref:Lipopolysaccharide core heptose(II) kinase RfaY n=1 Tax=Tolypocladium capitatum TaxID=45235 RepID=A0A2K3QLB1_9HYPO|nr:Lipopolysaccharide core heptose(II) kinase RfaY [Tolypocladium capitatum]
MPNEAPEPPATDEAHHPVLFPQPPEAQSYSVDSAGCTTSETRSCRVMSTAADANDTEDDGRFQYADEPPPLAPSKPSLEIRIPDHQALNEPERYRLPSRIGVREPMVPQDEETFRTRAISATSVVADSRYPHIRRLHLHPSSFERFVKLVINLLPAVIGVRIQAAFPEWFLPCDIILKSEKEQNKELFDTEVRAYKQLAALQGVVVPRCYGSVAYKGLRSLLLQDLASVSLAEPAGLTLSLPELSILLQECHRELHSHDVHQDDPRLGNFLLVGRKLMAIGFEMVGFDLSDDDKALFMKTNVLDLLDEYRSLRKSEWMEGNLEVD